MITYPISSKFCKESFSVMLLALQVSIFLMSSFRVFHFNRKNEIKKGNTLMVFKYLLFCSSINLFDVKDV